MLKRSQLQLEIEEVRKKLSDMVVAKRGTADPEVARLSMYLDELIVRYERSKAESGGKGRA